MANAQLVNLAAFAPTHESFAQILGTEINALVYPDWQASQRHDLDEVIAKPNCSWIVAELDHRIVGFVVVETDRETEVGELQMIAVHPELQSALNLLAEFIKDSIEPTWADQQCPIRQPPDDLAR